MKVCAYFSPGCVLFFHIVKLNKLYLGSKRSRAHKNGRLEEERVTPIETRSLGKIFTKNRTPGTCLATCVCAAVHMCIIISSTDGKFRPVWNLHSYTVFL